MLWHEQSWPTIQSLDKETPVVLPLASVEQHGHHLPVFVDTIQVTRIAEQVEQEMGDAVLVGPTQWLGSSHHHGDFPGTISVLPSLYAEMIKSITRCVLRAGFRRVMFLNGHGGNIVPGTDALSELVAEEDTANDALLAFSSWWHVGSDGIDPERQGMTTPRITHACEYETSLMMFFRPDLVHADLIRVTKPPLSNKWNDSFYGGKVTVLKRFASVTDAGNMGRPDEATAEKGKALFEGVISEVVAFLGEFRTWPHLERIGPK